MLKMRRYYGIFKEKSEKISLFLFLVGTIAGILLRAVLILGRINAGWANIAWYSSMILLIFFYSYRIYIENERQKLIEKHELRKKLKTRELSAADIKRISVIIDSVAISKVKWNNFLFLLMSLIFLIFQAIIDIMKII